MKTENDSVPQYWDVQNTTIAQCVKLTISMGQSAIQMVRFPTSNKWKICHNKTFDKYQNPKT
jgi:hypothetical protein